MTIPQENIQNTPVNTQETAVQKTNDKEYNFGQIRKQLEAERQARLQAEARAEELEKSYSKARNEEDDDDEPYVDHKKLNKKLASFEQSLEKKIEEKAEMKARMMIEEERRSAYLKENNDFNTVMNEQNIQKFAEKFPHLAKTIINMPESFERQKLVYENIKALGVDKPESKQPSIQEKIDANKRSPYYQPTGVPSASYGHNGDFSESGQKNAYSQMQALKKRIMGGR